MSTGTLTREIIVAPFAIEADHPRNCDLMLQSIPGCRLRSAILGTKGVETEKGYRVPQDQARHMASFPRVPGMIVKVVPHELKYYIKDPLVDNPEICERIKQWMNENTGILVQQIRGTPPRMGELDEHRMKTLCRELLRIVNCNEARLESGTLPDLGDIDQLPGDYLLNPGLQTTSTQPLYEKDWDAWVRNLSAMGG